MKRLSQFLVVTLICLVSVSSTPGQKQRVPDPIADPTVGRREFKLPPEQVKLIEFLEQLPGRNPVETEHENPEAPVIGVSLYSRKVTDDVVKSLKVFPKLRKVYLQSTAVTDAGLKELKALKNLKELRVFSDQIGDEGLKEVGQLAGLEVLELGSPEVTSAGLHEVGKLKNLRQLSLGCMAITDANLKGLAELKRLERLNVVHSQLSEPAIAALRKASPKLTNQESIMFDRVPPILGARPLKVAAGDDALQKLLKARYNAAVAELLNQFWQFLYARGTLDAMYDTCDRLTRAGLELHPAPADQVLFLERLLELAKIVEQMQEARVDSGRISPEYLERSRYQRLDLEVQLHRLKDKAK